MANMEFRVCWNSHGAHWVVQLGNVHYGAYLSKEQAVLDAGEAGGKRRCAIASRIDQAPEEMRYIHTPIIKIR